MKTDSVHNIIQRVHSLYNKGAQSDESRLTPRHIYSVVLSNRATLLEQQSKKKQKINQFNYQTIKIELEEINSIQLDCKNLPLDCSYFRSKKPIPRLLSDYNKTLIQSVTSLDGRMVFNETTPTKNKYSKGNRYAKTPSTYFFDNNYLVIKNTSGTPMFLYLTAVFEDPIEAQKFDDECSKNPEGICKSNFEYDFNMDQSNLSTVIQMSADELINWFNNMREDVSNNSKDSTIDTSK